MAASKDRTKKLRKRAFDRQGGLCWWCGTPMLWKTKENAHLTWSHPLVCTAEHVLHRCLGGKTSDDNIVAAHRSCNNRRQPDRNELREYRRNLVALSNQAFTG